MWKDTILTLNSESNIPFPNRCGYKVLGNARNPGKKETDFLKKDICTKYATRKGSHLERFLNVKERSHSKVFQLLD